MRILDRYLLREFVSFLALGLFTFLGFFVIVDVFEKVDTFVDHQAPVSLIIRFYVAYIPWVLVQILPVAMLLASLMSLGRFARQHELTAMLMAGQSLWRIFLPIFAFAFMVSAAAFALEQGVVPAANFERRMIMDHEIKKRPRPSAKRERNIRYIGEGGRIYLITTYDATRSLMRNVVIQEFADNVLARRTDARLIEWKEDHWLGHGVTVRTFSGDSLSVLQQNRMRLEIPERPADFEREERETDEMGLRELRTRIDRVRMSGGDATELVVDLHMKVSVPLTSLITVLIGAPLSTRVRRGGLAFGFGLSLLISFIYYCGLRAGESLGHGGAVPPIAAAWAANLLFGGIGTALCLRTQGSG